MLLESHLRDFFGFYVSTDPQSCPYLSLDDGRSKKTEQVLESVERIDDDCDTRELIAAFMRSKKIIMNLEQKNEKIQIRDPGSGPNIPAHIYENLV
jgi:hypothetical protein